METDAYIGLVMQDQMEDFTKLIADYPALNELFGDAWFASIAHVGMDSKKVHPLFWELANPIVNRHHAEALLRLKDESSSYGRYIGELKAAHNRGEVMGSIREADTYHALRSRGIDVEWKPVKHVGGKTYKPDLLIKGERPIYLEILAITDSEADMREEEAHNLLSGPWLVARKVVRKPLWCLTKKVRTADCPQKSFKRMAALASGRIRRQQEMRVKRDTAASLLCASRRARACQWRIARRGIPRR
ncbi:MAG TPA: hypothetical protein VG102_01740 [Candidatus Paceibacterota bacterium]|jgi:hypothetical protein|nr:hypothetical protein [Candidatus Paceibacterota bacterium]